MSTEMMDTQTGPPLPQSPAASAAESQAADVASQHAEAPQQPPPPAAKKRKREAQDADAEGGAARVNPAAAAAPGATGGAVAAAASSAPSLLIGALGGEAIKSALATQHPTPYIQQFQREHAIGAPSLEASLCFLDLFAPRRAPMYATLVSELGERLTDKIRQGQLPQDKVLSLLEASFPYIRVDELRGVPIGLLQSLLSSAGGIPPKYLKALVASPTALIESLPLPLRRCLMEAEPQRLFCQHPHWRSMLLAYANDTARIEAYSLLLPLEHMSPACKRVRHAIAPVAGGPAVSSASATALQGLLEWIGSSYALYDHMCAQLRDLVLSAEREGRLSDAQAWRSLRVDLLMRLHEMQHEQKHAAHAHAHAPTPGHSHAHAHAGKTHLASHIDPLHTWLWCLDAGVREKGQLSAKLLDKLVGSTPAPTPGEGGAAAGGAAAAPGSAASNAAAAPAATPGFLSLLKAKHVTRSTLADLSLLTSHPFIVVTLLQSLLSALAQALEKEITPREHGETKPLTALLHLALSPAQDMMLDDVPSTAPLDLPEPRDAEALYSEFYPLIAELMIYAQLGEMEPLNPRILEFASSSPVARALFLYYTMTRVQARDALQSAALLSALPSLQAADGSKLWSSSQVLQGEQQWVHAVLRTLTALITEQRHVMKTDAALRTAVFSQCFLPLARLSPVAYREALRLLLECNDCLTAEESVGFLQSLQREGCRAPSPPPQQQPAAAAEAEGANLPPLAPTSNTHAQIAGLYQKLQAAQPQLFRQAKKQQPQQQQPQQQS